MFCMQTIYLGKQPLVPTRAQPRIIPSYNLHASTLSLRINALNRMDLGYLSPLLIKEKLLSRAGITRLLVLHSSFPHFSESEQEKWKITVLTNHIACHPGSLPKDTLEKTEDQK